MKSKSNIIESNGFQVMDVIFNYLLFGCVVPLRENTDSYKLQKNLISIINDLEKHPEKVIVFLEKAITEILQDKLKAEDLVDVVKIYQYSNDKLIIHRLIDRQKKIYSFKFQNFPTDLTDQEIANTLIVRRFLPVHIFTFLLNRFLVAISFIYVGNGDTISQEQYQTILAVYKAYYDVPELIRITSIATLLQDRSDQNFFTEQDEQDYKKWIKSEIEKQPKYSINLA